MSFLPTCIKASQDVEIVLSGTSNIATLSRAVDPTASMLLFHGFVSADNTAQIGWDDFAIGALTDATTVTASKPGTGAWALTWCGEVIEYLKYFVKSYGSGSILIADGAISGTATIPSVNLTKTHLGLTGWTIANSTPSGSPSQLVSAIGALRKVDSTTLQAFRSGTAPGGTSLTVGYNYVEFK